jgi:predicted O-methyltransferase YrrM
MLMTDIVFNTEMAAFGGQAFSTSAPQVHKCSGFGLAELLKDKKNPVGVEIGIAEGFTSERLLKCNDTLVLHCIDPFADYVDWNGNNLNDRQIRKQEFLEKTEQFKDHRHVYEKTSDDAVSEFEDGSLDFIFIDGLHTYDQVKKDMENFYPKIKSGGLFAGHDYTVIAAVNKAVTEFADKHGIKKIGTTDCDVWYWYKP